MSLVANRLRNTAFPKDVAKALRSEIPEGASAVHLDENLDGLCCRFKDATLAILRCTGRPTKELLKSAAQLAWATNDAKVSNHFGERMYAAFQHCRLKKKNSVTGERLPEGVKAVVRAMIRLDSFLECPKSWSPTTEKPPVKASIGQKLKMSARLKMQASSPKQAQATGTNRRVVSASSSTATREQVLAMYGALEEGEVVLIASQEDEPEAKTCTRSVKLQHVDRCLNKLVRFYDDGSKEEAIMTPSPSGFCLAQFLGEDKLIETDIPNLVLNVMKRPAAAAAPRKRPASTPPDTEVSSVPAPLAVSSSPEGLARSYTNPYRYPTGSWGVRRAFSNKDNKQVFQFKKSGWTEAQNKQLCEEAVSKLRAGESEQSVVAWVNNYKKS